MAGVDPALEAAGRRLLTGPAVEKLRETQKQQEKDARDVADAFHRGNEALKAGANAFLKGAVEWGTQKIPFPPLKKLATAVANPVIDDATKKTDFLVPPATRSGDPHRLIRIADPGPAKPVEKRPEIRKPREVAPPRRRPQAAVRRQPQPTARQKAGSAVQAKGSGSEVKGTINEFKETSIQAFQEIRNESTTIINQYFQMVEDKQEALTRKRIEDEQEVAKARKAAIEEVGWEVAGRAASMGGRAIAGQRVSAGEVTETVSFLGGAVIGFVAGEGEPEMISTGAKAGNIDPPVKSPV